MKLLVWLTQFVPPSMCLSLGLSCCLAWYWYKIRCCGSIVSLLRERKGKGPRQCVEQLSCHLTAGSQGSHAEGSISSSHPMGIIPKRTSSSRLRLWREKSEAGLPVWLSLPVQGLPGNHSTSQRARQLQSVPLEWGAERGNLESKCDGWGRRQSVEKTGSRDSHVPVLTSAS